VSESAPESGGRGSVFTRKLGPLPMWGWMGIALLLAIGFYLFNKSRSGATSTSGQSSATNNSPGGVDSSLVPQFINQTYVENSPPAAPPAQTTTPTATGTPPASPLNEILQAGHVLNATPGNTEVGWTIAQKSANATQLKVVVNGPGIKNQTRYVPATATTATIQNTQPGHTYNVSVTPVDSAGQAVGGPNNIDVVTSKK
jgi:hypothetical protein